MAYIRIKKPVGGVTEVEFDAHSGPTGYRERSGPIPVGQLGATVSAYATEYMKRRADAKALRRGRPT